MKKFYCKYNHWVSPYTEVNVDVSSMFDLRKIVR